MLPRLCVTAFTFAQPFLVNTTIKLVGDKNANVYHGKGLIGAWALVYLGLAVGKIASNIIGWTNDLDAGVTIFIHIRGL